MKHSSIATKLLSLILCICMFSFFFTETVSKVLAEDTNFLQEILPENNTIVSDNTSFEQQIQSNGINDEYIAYCYGNRRR